MERSDSDVGDMTESAVGTVAEPPAGAGSSRATSALE
jgi:hypothetical protein